MTDPDFYLAMAGAALAAIGIVCYAGLTGWRGWLSLKHEELHAAGDRHAPASPSAGARIEIADLKERIRKLEAIAAGVDL